MIRRVVPLRGLMLAAASAAALMLLLPGSALAASVANGNFETGNLSGWTVVNSGNGNWFAYSGTSAPLSGLLIAAPPQGTFAATSDQTGPGSHILYQDIALEPAFNHTLTFTLYYRNWAGAFFTPNSLSESVPVPNEQFRVDIIKPSAPVDSVAAGDILTSVFQTHVLDPLALAPTSMSVDLTPFAGQTVRLRFAEVDNQSFFQASLDGVQIVSTPRVIQVGIDIKPGSSVNPINLGAKGTVPVAILGSGTFDATQVDPATVKLAGAPVRLNGQGQPLGSFQDVNGDGLLDLLVQVESGALQLTSSDTQATLTGTTFSGTPITGTDSVSIVPK
jgi:hypothetical protein